MTSDARFRSQAYNHTPKTENASERKLDPFMTVFVLTFTFQRFEKVRVERYMGRKKLDLVDQRFGRLVVIGEAGRNKFGNVMWLCKCDCGAEVTVIGNDLRSDRTRSCGCLRRECVVERSTKHGMTKTRLFSVWQNMLTRVGIYKCFGEEHKRDYINSGITVCNEWLVFENFRDWSLSNGYSESLQIDRVNNDAGYCPSNCRWTTAKENMNNRRCTIRLEDGTPLADFCSKVGIQTRENGKVSKQYNRIKQAYSRYHKAHPELLAKANEAILVCRQCIELLELLDEVKQLKKIPKTEGERP